MDFLEPIVVFASDHVWSFAAFAWPLVLPNPVVHRVGYIVGRFFRTILGQRKVFTYFRGSLYALTSGLQAGIDKQSTSES